MGKYESVEEKIFDYLEDKGVFGFCGFFGQSLYSTLASGFRIPTFIRKMANEQYWIERHRRRSGIENSELFGAVGGLISAFGLEAYGIVSLVREAHQGNYTPLIATGATVLATNLMSFVYEMGRLHKSREERERGYEEKVWKMDENKEGISKIKQY